MTPDLRTYDACAAACDWQQALELWEHAPLEHRGLGRMQALAAGRQWQAATACLKELGCVSPASWQSLRPSYGWQAALSACIHAFQEHLELEDWQLALHLLQDVGDELLEAALSLICSPERWQIAVALLPDKAPELLASRVLSACERAQAWAAGSENR